MNGYVYACQYIGVVACMLCCLKVNRTIENCWKKMQPQNSPTAASPLNNSNNNSATNEEDKSYLDFLERYAKSTTTNIKSYENIIVEDDETTKQTANKATDAEIKYETDLLLGSVKDWCTNSDDCIIFRDNMKKYQIFCINYIVANYWKRDKL